ncbi:MAG TPA: NAD(P)-dependent alcohol dehydrogenase [Dermatophilaceae bacterium]|nr:NAD(P)-dependent alcohol dehydrogenase [Dermatophilaceae bacterium]
MTSTPSPAHAHLPEHSRTAVLTEPGTIVVEDRPMPVPAPDEVVIEVRAVGVCGSDTHYFDDGRIGHFVVEGPFVLGHESSGVVVATGADVDPARIGERVSIEPGVPCRACEQCLAGRYNLCPDMRFHATPPFDGSLTQYVAHHHAFAFPVPDSVSDEAAALVEPLSVGVWACRKAAIGVGSRVLVTGAGPIGLVCVQAALAAGATEVVVADVNPHRLSLAARLGATATVDLTTDDLPRTYAGRPGPNALLECSGHPGSTLAAIHVLAPAGCAVMVGTGSGDLTLPLQAIQERELVVTGVFRYANTWPAAIALVASGRVDLDALVTGHFRLDQSAEALTASRRDPTAVKSVIHPQD